jgi:hypothetical protein
MSENQEFWFNMKSRTVETGPQSLSIDRVGPFETHELALQAPEIIEGRARAIRDQDLEEEDWDSK